MHKKSYLRLAVMTLAHFAAMYVLMYAMVNVFENVIPNFNQFYMAALMTAPMVILELLLMGSMYPKKHVNALIIVLSVAVLTGSFVLIRLQTFISDTELLNSMIPHHASALLMCQNASLKDEQVKLLCANITFSQRAEIDWMNAKLKSLGN